MKTLIINFHIRDPELRLHGLTFKALRGTNSNHNIYRDDCGCYAIDTSHNINGRTSKIELCFLISILKDIHERIGFDQIKYEGYYPTSPNELLNLIKANQPRLKA